MGAFLSIKKKIIAHSRYGTRNAWKDSYVDAKNADSGRVTLQY